MAFTIKYDENSEFEVDHFSKLVMFQKIIDMDISKNEKSLCLYILRKTLCFDKLDDRLSMYYLQKELQLSNATLRKTISLAEENDLIKVVRSKGGDMQSSKKYSLFRLSNNLLMNLIQFIEEVRETNDFK